MYEVVTMGSGWLWILIWISLTGRNTAGDAPDPQVVRVASALGSRADRVFTRVIHERLGNLVVQVEGVEPRLLRDRLHADGDRQPDVLLGAPVELFSSPAVRDRLAPYVPPWASSLPPSCRERHGLWHALLLEPLVIAYSRAGLRGVLGARGLPGDYGDLGAPRWEGEVTLPDSTPYSEGAFLVLGLMERSQREHGDIRRALETLSQMDANLPLRESGAPDYARGSAGCASRLLDRERPEVVGVVRLGVLLESDSSGELGWVSPPGGTLAWPRCVVLVAKGAANPGARAVIDLLGEPSVLEEVAAVMHAVPACRLVASRALPGAEWRFAVEGEGRGVVYPSDPLAIGREGPTWLARFEAEVRGRVRSQYATFDAAFEWLGLVVLAGVLVFMYLETGRRR